MSSSVAQTTVYIVCDTVIRIREL